MLLLICRHARAAERDDVLFPDDTLRPLVPAGKRAQERLARRLVRRGFVPSVIYSSPWKRAWQTAGILARETGIGKRRRIALPALADDPDLDAIGAAVGSREPDEVVALVGHEPWVGELVSVLLTGSVTRLSIRFPKSGIVGVTTDNIAPAAGQLRFFFDR